MRDHRAVRVRRLSRLLFRRRKLLACARVDAGRLGNHGGVHQHHDAISAARGRRRGLDIGHVQGFAPSADRQDRACRPFVLVQRVVGPHLRHARGHAHAALLDLLVGRPVVRLRPHFPRDLGRQGHLGTWRSGFRHLGPLVLHALPVHSRTGVHAARRPADLRGGHRSLRVGLRRPLFRLGLLRNPRLVQCHRGDIRRERGDWRENERPHGPPAEVARQGVLFG
mmetsp:Transcript_33605/g.95638  ORF Transcript_33605/g.95638 Transcript_33605/m.95638 type:complete len:224 (+) Transcript_33605:986-1657(+)